MSEPMNVAKFDGLWQRATHGGGDAQDARELAHEAHRARQEETQQQDRIHALEVQQAELLRQVKEKDAEIARLRECMATALIALPNSFADAARTLLTKGLGIP